MRRHRRSRKTRALLRTPEQRDRSYTLNPFQASKSRARVTKTTTPRRPPEWITEDFSIVIFASKIRSRGRRPAADYVRLPIRCRFAAISVAESAAELITREIVLRLVRIGQQIILVRRYLIIHRAVRFRSCRRQQVLRWKAVRSRCRRPEDPLVRVRCDHSPDWNRNARHHS
jgi:hypothetical protein